MEILMATNNKHKVEELSRIFTGHKLLTPREVGLSFEHEETEETFLGNALGKGMALYKMTGKPVIADDSGLCVTALNNAPGVYSARYGSEGNRELSSPERNALLLQNMEGKRNREAFFVCAMVLIMSEHRIFSAQETVEGEITTKPAGGGGFGYDPVFFLPGYNCTMAEVSPAVKDEISHRGRACRVIAGVINQWSR